MSVEHQSEPDNRSIAEEIADIDYTIPALRTILIAIAGALSIVYATQDGCKENEPMSAEDVSGLSEDICRQITGVATVNFPNMVCESADLYYASSEHQMCREQ